METSFSDFFGDPEFVDSCTISDSVSAENLFGVLKSLEDSPITPLEDSFVSVECNGSFEYEINENEALREKKRLKREEEFTEEESLLQPREKTSHITVERNRRKQINQHMAVLRSLMPCFYVKRGDQASIIGGVVEYITELKQLLKSLEEKKQRKVYSEVLSPRPPAHSPKLTHSPTKTPLLSPRTSFPATPRTPQPANLYKPRIQPSLYPMVSPHKSCSSFDSVKDLSANSRSAIADVEVKFSGPNVLVKAISNRTPGQILKIISTLERHSFEILHVSVSTTEDTVINSFTIKIGIECKLSAEDLVDEIQQTFC